MNKFYKIVPLILVALLSAAVAGAGPIIYDNGPPSEAEFLFSDNFPGFETVAADDFMLNPGASTIGDIHWSGSYDMDGPHTDNFQIKLYTDGGGGLPGTTLHTLNVGIVNREAAVGLYSQGDTDFPIFNYWLDITPIDLTANTTYWLSIQNLLNTDQDRDFEWVWEGSSLLTGNTAAYLDDPEGNPWSNGTSSDIDLSFQLTGPEPIPEPATVALLGIGLAGLIGIGARKRLRLKKGGN